MRRFAAAWLSVVIAGGCQGLINFAVDTRTAVVLNNRGTFPVDVVLFTSDEQDIPESLLVNVGDEREISIPAGESRRFTVDCEELQAIIIDDADLRIVGQVGPEARTNALRDGDDFGCGDTIEFTFRHTAALIDFDIEVTVVPAPALP